jgi:CheY-like chemotaxis protein
MTLKNILVVENDTSTRRLLDVLLRRAGHTVTSVDSGQDALDLLAKHKYDLAVVDLMMPNVSGRDVIAYIAENVPSTPVILCTAAPPAIAESLPSHIVRAVIHKPFNILEITGAVDEHARTLREPAMTVLIVDDDERARYIMRTMVDPARVVEAQDAEAALQAVAQERPDAVLLDLMLPGVPGEEVLRTLKENPATSDIPIVIVTSRKLSSNDAMPPGLERADGYIYKGDLSRETIATVLQVILETRGR